MTEVLSDLHRKVVIADLRETAKAVAKKIGLRTTKFFGLCLVLDNDGKLLGIINSGDIVRLSAEQYDFQRPVADCMNRDPVTISTLDLAAGNFHQVHEAALLRSGGRSRYVSYLPVIDQFGKVADVLAKQDILALEGQERPPVAVYGLGYVGLTLAAVAAGEGSNTIGIDINQSIISNLCAAKMHVHEPGLSDLIQSSLKNKTLRFTSNLEETVEATVHIIAVGTPVQDDGVVDSGAIISVAKNIGKRLRAGDLVMLRSTVPLETTRKIILPILELQSGMTGGESFSLAFCPERTVEGNAVEELQNLPQIIGGLTASCSDKAAKFWRAITSNIKHVDSLEEAELVKLINNTFRDISFAFSNAVAMLCSEYNIKASKLIAHANDGYTRNPIARPSPGVGGYCLTKDPLIFSSSGSGGMHSELATLGRKINRASQEYPLRKIEDYLLKYDVDRKLGDLTVFVIGVAFKGQPETNDMRGSSAVALIESLTQTGATVFGYDAVITAADLEAHGITALNYEQGIKISDVVCIMNNHPANVWDNFSQLDRQNTQLVFDGWSQLDPHQIEIQDQLVYSTLGYMTPPQKRC